eukprot:SAG11_NODE_7824_length_1092_cov_1.061430_1_plen_78_part_10
MIVAGQERYIFEVSIIHDIFPDAATVLQDALRVPAHGRRSAMFVSGLCHGMWRECRKGNSHSSIGPSLVFAFAVVFIS